MFTAAISPVVYADPWAIGFDERFATMMQGSPRAAYYYARPDTSTFRYRAYNVSQALSSGPASASWFTEDDLGRMAHVIDSCDVLVLCRNSLYTSRIAELAMMARARGRRILFDVDDLVFDPNYVHLIMDTLAQDTTAAPFLDFWFAYVGRVSATFALCDAALVTNDILAARATEWSGRPAHVLPNALNREQQAVSARVWDAKERSAWARDGRIHLGYFSGSPSHNRDFALVAGPVARLMDRHPDVWLRVVGFLDHVGDLERHRDRIEFLPLQDFINLQREIGAVEISLVPLQDNDFTNCKSELKWFEAAIVGTLTVASPSFAYRNVIDHGRNGWLSASHEWEAILETIITDHSGHPAVRETARVEALARYGWENQAARIRQALQFG